jgi:hypothetical protein
MRVLIILFFLLSFLYSKSQDSKYIEFTKSFIHSVFEKKDQEQIFAYRSLDTTTISELKFFVNTSILKNYHAKSNQVKDSLLLTVSEVEYINDHLSNQNNEWITKSFINSFDFKSEISKSYKTIYSFSNPIFIRNETICIFYYEFTCGRLCGESHFCVYRKQKNKWILYLSILDSIS